MRSALFAYIMNKLRERAVYQSPLLLLFILLVTIFTVEFTIMFLIHYLGIPEWGETLVDSSLLSIVIFPVLYFFVFRPLKLYIAELKKAEDILRDSRESLHRLLNSMVEGVYGIDTNGNCTFANQAALQIIGYQNEDEVLGKNMHTLIHHSHSDGSSYPASECRIYWAYQTIQTINVSDEVLWRKDGIAVPVEYWSRPVVIDGVVAGAIVSFVDITERKKAAEELQVKTNYLERFNRLMVGRELEMIKLKAEVNELLEKSGQPKKYEAPDEVKDAVRSEIWR